MLRPGTHSSVEELPFLNNNKILADVLANFKRESQKLLYVSMNFKCTTHCAKTPPKSKRVKPDDDVSEDVKTPNEVERIKKRQEKFNNLFSNAV